ncbi:MAG: response regulator transcription factor [Hyphomonadaceae bacterium]|nr:response regulator transcription factor [Hyphomonadaceae bacterium]
MRPRTAPRILLVDDEAALRQEVLNGLDARGYCVVCASSVREGEIALERGGISIVVLDINMPERDGWSFLPELVNSWNLPVIVLTGNIDLKTRLLAFKHGAVDYLAKPFFIEELVARIRSRVFAETYTTARKTLRFGACEIDLEARTVLVHGASVTFTEAEFDILAYFAARPGRAISRSVLAEKALSTDGERTDRTIDSHVSRIRTKLGAEGAHLKTAWGIGWKLETKLD